jgi:hypothetical protein
MGNQLSKLRPDRDLQCYYFQPSAVAALSGATNGGFTVSGSWRQQFDWAVVEWNRDNTFEHPAFRNLPDGDLSGLTLTYNELRSGCIPLDSKLYPTVDWPSLRIWAADASTTETIYYVPLLANANPIGAYTAGTASFTLSGSITSGDYIELAWLDGGVATQWHFNYPVSATDTLESAAAALASMITANQATGMVRAEAAGATITLTYLGTPGSNANRVGVYGSVYGAGTEVWTPAWQYFAGGTSPAAWAVTLKFGDLQGYKTNDTSQWLPANAIKVPTSNVRKLRWTWAPDLQMGNFTRSEFSVAVSGWTVSGTNLEYKVTGPGSRRIESFEELDYAGEWRQSVGNYSGGSIRATAQPGAAVTCRYTAMAHQLYLGIRCADRGAPITVQVDGAPAVTIKTELAGEDISTRFSLGMMAAGQHTVTATHAGTLAQTFWFDFLELAVPSATLPVFVPTPKTTLATDWDTLHSQAIAPERTAWLMASLGFHGRANHYAGALCWYELVCPGNRYASSTVNFRGAPEWSKVTSVTIGGTRFEHLNLIGDTAASVARALALSINAGATAVWATASGRAMTLTSRTMGTAGNGLAIDTATGTETFTCTVSGPLAGGLDGKWLTDVDAMPRMNRAARDWHAAFFGALKAYGIEVACAFSMELANGDDSPSAGLAQRYPNGTACWVNTPALQTNFGPQSTAFWTQAYLDMAWLMAGAGVNVYLQFGEVQWWYFCPPSDPTNGNWAPLLNGGMPFYDDYSTAAFQTTFKAPMHVFTDPSEDPSPYPHESAFLPGLIGTFTAAVRAAVRACYPSASFEVLYPTDTNNALLTKVVNLPVDDWTPGNISCLKTENFTYTGDRNLNRVRESVQLPAGLGFPPAQTSHLVGIGDFTTPWGKEWSLGIAAGAESVVLFALDQFCLIGYSLPLSPGDARSGYMG